MATLSYFLRSKSDNCSIYCRLTIDRKTQFEKKTGLNIDFKDWSIKTKLPNQNSRAEIKSLKFTLEKLRLSILDQVNISQVEGKIITSSWLDDIIKVFFGLKSNTGKDDTVIGAIDRFIKNGKTKRGLANNTIKNYNYLKTKFVAFQADKVYRVKDVDRFFADDFLDWLQEIEKLSEGSSNKILRNLISVCKEAKTYEIETSVSLSNITTKRHVKANKIYLSPLELLKIEKAKIIQPYLQNARKWILLGCEIGQRVSDLPKINPDNIQEYEGMKFLVIQTKKTKKEAVIPIVGKIKELLSDGFPRPISSAKLNKYIKKVCEVSEINTPTFGEKRDKDTKRMVTGTYPKHELITTHCLRYSFVTNSSNIISNQLIRTITTHTTDKMMENYNAKELFKKASELGKIQEEIYKNRIAPMAANN